MPLVLMYAGNSNIRLEFETKSGILVARRDDRHITLDFPANPPGTLTPAEEVQLAKLMKVASGGLSVSQVLLSRTTKKLLIRLHQSCSRCVPDILFIYLCIYFSCNRGTQPDRTSAARFIEYYYSIPCVLYMITDRNGPNGFFFLTMRKGVEREERSNFHRNLCRRPYASAISY